MSFRTSLFLANHYSPFLLSMADKQPSKRRAAGGLSILSLGAILAFIVYTWYTPGADLLPRSIVARHTGDLDLQGTPEHLSNLTLERRQSFQCGAGNPCSNGACCGGSGYCGYGEPSVKANIDWHMELMLDRPNILREWLRF